jgi:hypothetical protein
MEDNSCANYVQILSSKLSNLEDNTNIVAVLFVVVELRLEEDEGVAVFVCNLEHFLLACVWFVRWTT